MGWINRFWTTYIQNIKNQNNLSLQMMRKQQFKLIDLLVQANRYPVSFDTTDETIKNLTLNWVN